MEKTAFDTRYQEYLKAIEEYLNGLFAEKSHWADLYSSAAFRAASLPPAAATPSIQAPAIMAPVFRWWTSATSGSVRQLWSVSSTCPATMPSAPEAFARIRAQSAR